MDSYASALVLKKHALIWMKCLKEMQLRKSHDQRLMPMELDNGCNRIVWRHAQTRYGVIELLISGLEQNLEGGKDLSLFRKMSLRGERLDLIDQVSVPWVCFDFAALINGKWIQGLVMKNGFELCLSFGNDTVDMYTKSGCMDGVCILFWKHVIQELRYSCLRLVGSWWFELIDDTSTGTRITLVINLWVGVDHHETTNFIAKIEWRVNVARSRLQLLKVAEKSMTECLNSRQTINWLGDSFP